ncbi:STAS/SEC14 domain-containing protein [Alsobacter sp. SYSU M60028]|uniref:STAS/SEC14 domain-containing protein n=1 Tax=Alsobacter ponti TaxID=2962936 RepID=A0ABT1LG52_9HYPH|nr:STAS/SEC14 domain-containing protein [Alsobacter ponti]MCP8940480.1 STAS/SEC14 domain-containing protein [Alsobacter ponti]
MVHTTVDPERGLVVIEPDGPLRQEDFERLRDQLAPVVSQGRLRGVVLRAANFPGWSDFDAFAAHVAFVKDHQRNVQRVAVVSDSPLLKALPAFARVLISPEIRHFDAADFEAAERWAATGEATA